MIRRPPRSTLSSSSAASDVYKRQAPNYWYDDSAPDPPASTTWERPTGPAHDQTYLPADMSKGGQPDWQQPPPATGGQAPPQEPQQVYPVQPAGMVIVGQQPVVAQTMTVTRYRMGGMAWCMVCLLILLFWPLCWIPCVCEGCQEPYQETMIIPVTQVVHHHPPTRH
eukprot:TRINITY_DN1883_c0_g1_i2.p1 TRINITY_DN1883_c0_g1~~TRINITY_DN1883_c0_g1_i2.p1  ORF type:complete len:167 (-),score=4.96 TRINITY_DN1883_c0_g1_i2:353-853(-)